MRIFKNWTYNIAVEPATDSSPEYQFWDVKSADGTDWYELMVELDDRAEKYVVGTQPSGHLAWFSKGSVRALNAPLAGGDVIVLDDYPEDIPLGDLMWDGSKVVKKPEVIVERTKADIEKDLMALMDELKGMS